MTAVAMEPQELKALVDTGAYKPDPGAIAAAMLSRRGVRELLTGIDATGPRSDRIPGSGRSPRSQVARPRAA